MTVLLLTIWGHVRIWLEEHRQRATAQRKNYEQSNNYSGFTRAGRLCA